MLAELPHAKVAIEVKGLRKFFDTHEVLKGIDFEIFSSEVVCIIGRSGSGKSTLLRCLNALETFQHGLVKINEKELNFKDNAQLRELRQEVGMIFQSFNLFPHLSVGENLMLAPQLVQKKSKVELLSLSHDLLRRVGLSDKFHAFPDQLSGGQQQRVAIARALAMNPSILLCDEITSALDPELVGEVLGVVEALAKEGMTLLMVTHEMNFAKKVSHRIVFMHEGRVHETGTPDELFSNPQTPELKQFLSSIH
jgi:polar amino acid transport system ATP-binding protein